MSDYRALISSGLSPACALGIVSLFDLISYHPLLSLLFYWTWRIKAEKFMAEHVLVTEFLSLTHKTETEWETGWSWWEGEYTNKWPTFLKAKQFQFQRSINCLAFSSNSQKLVSWIVVIHLIYREGRNRGWPTNFLHMFHNLALACSKLPQILVMSLMHGKLDI